MNLQLRINGTAPAWPVLLEHPSAFYDPSDIAGMGSASYSLIAYSDKRKTSVVWEILIDAGHNTVPFLLNHGNRIPDAIFLTHAHPDHMLGIDWIVQSHHFKFRNSKSKLPVYCTRSVWNMLMNTYSYIEPHVRFVELFPGQKQCIDETSGLYVTPYPVFHGKGAWGASMLYFETQWSNTKNLLITADMLCPLLRKKDIPIITQAGDLFIDTNNRFPYPESNHISFAKKTESEKISARLQQWFETVDISDLLAPHLMFDKDKLVKSYCDEFLSDWNHTSEIPHTILDFLSLIPIPEVFLIHYFGIYDEINYNEKILDANRLQQWAGRLAKQNGLTNIRIRVPKPGDSISLQKNTKQSG